MIRRPPRSTPLYSSAASDVYKRQVYELVEWFGGAFLGNDTANAFVGAQNDPWDSQKDMAVAVVGAFATLLLVSLRGRVQKQAMTTAR